MPCALTGSALETRLFRFLNDIIQTQALSLPSGRLLLEANKWNYFQGIPHLFIEPIHPRSHLLLPVFPR